MSELDIVSLLRVAGLGGQRAGALSRCSGRG